jgi:hypothetical protein
LSFLFAYSASFCGLAVHDHQHNYQHSLNSAQGNQCRQQIAIILRLVSCLLLSALKIKASLWNQINTQKEFTFPKSASFDL